MDHFTHTHFISSSVGEDCLLRITWCGLLQAAFLVPSFKIQWRSGIALFVSKGNTRQGNGSELEGIRQNSSKYIECPYVSTLLPFWYSEGLTSGHFQTLHNDCLRMLWRRFRAQVVAHHPAQSIWFFFPLLDRTKFSCIHYIMPFNLGLRSNSQLLNNNNHHYWHIMHWALHTLSPISLKKPQKVGTTICILCCKITCPKIIQQVSRTSIQTQVCLTPKTMNLAITLHYTN